MTKNEMIGAVANKIEGATKKDIGVVIDALTDVIKEAVLAGNTVTIPGIGKVSVKTVPERRGKIMMGNRKGEEYVVPEHREPKIKLTKSFKNIFEA